MRQLKVIFIFATLAGFVGCAGLKIDGAIVDEVTKPPVTAPPTPVPADAAALRAKVTDIALGDLCAKTAHDVQGTPPQGFMKGIALTYARAVCDPSQAWVKVASQPRGEAKSDFLAHYGLNPATADQRLQTTFSLLIGSAARESSWRWCVGKDPGASNTSAETCEAGLYQTSYNSRSASPVLPALFAQFKGNGAGCYAAEFKGKTTCTASNLKNYGEGEGVEFQRLSKECPGFATQYHAVMVRVRRSHYGPINIKKSEAKPVCIAMFERIRKAIEADRRICNVL